MSIEDKHKQMSNDKYIDLCVASIIVLWNSICNDSKTQKKKEKEEENKRIKEEEKENDDISKNISLIEDEELEIEEISIERKEGIEKLKDTIFKKKYEEYKTCENELKTDLDAMQKELTTIYDECEEIISTQKDKNKVDSKKTAELEAQIDSLIEDADNKYTNANSKWKRGQKIFKDEITKNVTTINNAINEGLIISDSEGELGVEAINNSDADTDIKSIKVIPNIINKITNITTQIDKIEKISDTLSIDKKIPQELR